MTAEISPARRRQVAILRRFVEVYCRRHHDGNAICPACQNLLDYALGRLVNCPRQPKPKCKDCPQSCYDEDYRRRMREVMRFSGMYFVRRGRLDWLLRYMLG
jgi:predicted amidophosphoribosyltransferase